MAGYTTNKRSAPAASKAPAARSSLRRLVLIACAFLFLLALGVYSPRLWSAWQERKFSRMELAELEAVVRNQPDNLKARYHLGLTYARANHYREAVEQFLAVLKQDPVRADVLNDLGVAYLLQDRYYESLVALQGALTARPDFAPAYANLGRLHLATKMPYTAERELQRAATLDPSNVDTLCDLGQAYQRTLNYKRSEESYRNALRLDPQNMRAHVGLGNTLYSMAQYDQAEQELNTALRQNPNDPSVLLSLARIRAERSTSDADVQAALQLAEQAGKADPKDPNAWYEQGRFRMLLRQAKEAVPLLTRAMQISPQHNAALFQLERALRASGRVAEADRAAKVFKERSLREREETHLEEHISHYPQDWDALARLTEIYFQSGNQALAALTLRRLKEGSPSHPRIPALSKMLTPEGVPDVPPALLQGDK